MSYTSAILEQLNELREARVDLLQEGRTTQAAYVQRQIHKLYERYSALTWATD